MSDEAKKPHCLACERESDVTPLVKLEYKGAPYWICPQHLPLLIHDPAQLIGKLEGAENLKPSDYHD
ncbi:MAG: hypothetical protein ACYS0E_11095 [Planctomycetota bacterium]|jgi:hypothetical protein